MKFFYLLVVGAVSVASFVIAAESPSIPYLQDQKLSSNVASIISGSNNLSEKVIALADIFNNLKLSETERISAANALALQTDSAGIEKLLQNIDVTLKTQDGINYIAVDALVIAGDRAVAPILEFLQRTEQNKRRALAVQAIVQIKGDGYQEFVDFVKSKVSPKVLESLVVYGVKY